MNNFYPVNLKRYFQELDFEELEMDQISNSTRALRLEESSLIEKVCGDIFRLSLDQILASTADRTDLYRGTPLHSPRASDALPEEKRAHAYTLLCYCAASQQPDLLKSLLEYRAEPNLEGVEVLDPSNTILNTDIKLVLQTPLQAAVRVGDLSSVRLLVEAGGDLNAEEYDRHVINSTNVVRQSLTLLEAALRDKISKGVTSESQLNISMLMFLLENGVVIKPVDIIAAAGTGSFDIVELLMNNYGAQVTPEIATDALDDYLSTKLQDVDFAIDDNFMRMFRFFRDQGAELEPLKLGFAHNPFNLQVIIFLIAQGIDVSKEDIESGLTPLMFAVARGSLELVTVLLEAGAKANYRISDLEEGEDPADYENVDDDSRPSALTQTCWVAEDVYGYWTPDCHNTEIVKQLLKYGAKPMLYCEDNPTKEDELSSPLFLAKKNGLTEIVAIFEEHIAGYGGWV